MAKQIERAKETERILSILHQWGIHTLGQLAALSRDDLAARLGMRAVEMWKRANGGGERILKLVSPPESFIESFEFENEIETVEPLLFILRRFLQQLATRLNAIYLVAKELRLRITFADKSHYERIFKIPQPTNNEDILFRMLHTHLENFTSRHPSVAKSRNPIALPLSFTTGSLGPSRTGIFARDDEERERGACDSTAVRGCVPLRRFRKRKKATVLLENNRPAHVRAAEVRAGLAVEGTTMAQDGPFSLSGNWWDERAWAQVEWDVEIENGVIARCHCDQDGWAIDGIYD